jgi:KDO2-lipid IV(A) lauroyltransferase
MCVARRYEHAGYQTILDRIRARLGVRARAQEESLVPVLRMLREGGALGLLPDQDFKQLHDGIFVDFLGRPAYTTTLPAQLALRTGAPLIVATTHREGDRLVVHSSELADPERFRRSRDPVRALTEWWSRELEARIRSHPSQWVWLHRRWRTTPDRLSYRAERRKEREVRRQ